MVQKAPVQRGKRDGNRQSYSAQQITVESEKENSAQPTTRVQ